MQKPSPSTRTHVGMSKFSSAEDEDFKTISKHLSIMAKAAPLKIAKNWEHHRRLDSVQLKPGCTFCPTNCQCILCGNTFGAEERILLTAKLPYVEGAQTFIGRQDVLNSNSVNIILSFLLDRKLLCISMITTLSCALFLEPLYQIWSIVAVQSLKLSFPYFLTSVSSYDCLISISWRYGRTSLALGTTDRKSTRLNSSHSRRSRMPSSA